MTQDHSTFSYVICDMYEREGGVGRDVTHSLIRVKVDGVKCFLEKGFHGSSLRAVTGPIPAIPDPSPSLWTASEPYCGKGFAL